MKITTITCKRIKNLGNFSAEHMEASADILETEDPNQAALELRRFVDKQLNIELALLAADEETPY